MCKFIGKSNERILCKLRKSEINRSCCHGNYKNVKFYLSIKIFPQYIFHLPSFSLWAATFLLPWFGKWHTHKLPKLCSPTNNTLIFNMKLFQSSINSIDKLNFPVMLHQKAMHYRRKNYGQKHCLWIMLSTGWITIH